MLDPYPPGDVVDVADIGGPGNVVGADERDDAIDPDDTAARGASADQVAGNVARVHPHGARLERDVTMRLGKRSITSRAVWWPVREQQATMPTSAMASSIRRPKSVSPGFSSWQPPPARLVW